MGSGQPQVSATNRSLLCRVCGGLNPVPEDAQRFDCRACSAKNLIVACERCHGAEVVPSRSKKAPLGWKCHWCLYHRANVQISRDGQRRRATAADAWQSLHDHGLTGSDPQVQVLGGFQVLAGSGESPAPGSLCSITALSDGVLITAEVGAKHSAQLAYQDLLELENGGRGALTSNGGFIGSGRGVTSSITGMAIASMLNNATRTTQIDSYLRITTPQTQILLRHWHYTPEQIRGALSRMFAAHLAATRAAATAPVVINPPSTHELPRSPIDELETLTKLHAAGTLTDTEFEAARARQIKQLRASQDS
jgi:hypothetical protein